MARKSAKMTPRKLPTGGTAVGTPRSPLTRPPVVDAPPDYIPPAPLPRPPSPRLPSPARSSPERPLAGIARKRAPDDSPSALDLRAPKRARTGPLASQARLDLLAHADRRPPSPPPLPSGMILPHDWTLGAGVVVPAVAPQRMASANRALGQTSSAASIGGGGKQRFLLARPSSVSHKRSRSSSVAVGSSPFKAVAALPPKTFVQQREEMWEDALEARITPHRRVYAPDPDDPIADPWTEGVTSHDHNDRPAPKNAFIGPDRFRYGYPVIRTPVQLRVAARPLDDVLPLYDPAEPRPQHRLQPRPSVITWAQFALHHADKVVVATATAEAARGHGPVVTATAEAVAERPAEAASAALVAASTAAADACS